MKFTAFILTLMLSVAALSKQNVECNDVLTKSNTAALKSEYIKYVRAYKRDKERVPAELAIAKAQALEIRKAALAKGYLSTTSLKSEQEIRAWLFDELKKRNPGFVEEKYTQAPFTSAPYVHKAGDDKSVEMEKGILYYYYTNNGIFNEPPTIDLVTIISKELFRSIHVKIDISGNVKLDTDAFYEDEKDFTYSDILRIRAGIIVPENCEDEVNKLVDNPFASTALNIPNNSVQLE